MKNIMVCVTKQKTCQRLIDYGRSQIESEDDQLFVIHVAGSDYNFLGNEKETEALEFLYEKAREAGANLTVEKSDDVLGTLAEIVKENHITDVITGSPGDSDENSGFLEQFRKKIGKKAKMTVLPAIS